MNAKNSLGQSIGPLMTEKYVWELMSTKFDSRLRQSNPVHESSSMSLKTRTNWSKTTDLIAGGVGFREGSTIYFFYNSWSDDDNSAHSTNQENIDTKRKWWPAFKAVCWFDSRSTQNKKLECWQTINNAIMSRQRDLGHRFSPREGWCSNQTQIVGNIRRYFFSKRITTSFISSEAFTRNSYCSNKEILKEVSVLKQFEYLSPRRSWTSSPERWYITHLSKRSTRWRTSKFKLKRRLKPKEIFMFRKLVKNSEEKKTRTMTGQFPRGSTAEWKNGDHHIKIQLTRRSNTKGNDYEIKNYIFRRKQWDETFSNNQEWVQCRSILTSLLTKVKKKVSIEWNPDVTKKNRSTRRSVSWKWRT